MEIVITQDAVLLVLCLWATVATGLALYNYKRFNKLDFVLGITMLGLKHVAEGKAELFIGKDGEVQMKKKGSEE